VLGEEQEKRSRPPVVLSEAEEDEIAVTVKEYTRHRSRQIVEETRWIQGAITRQERALKTLKAMSPHLYEQAIQPDTNSFPLRLSGPTLTPPIEGYQDECPDGEYVDTTKKYGGF